MFAADHVLVNPTIVGLVALLGWPSSEDKVGADGKMLIACGTGLARSGPIRGVPLPPMVRDFPFSRPRDRCVGIESMVERY
jgi:hypothetical protein